MAALALLIRIVVLYMIASESIEVVWCGRGVCRDKLCAGVLMGVYILFWY